MKSGARVRLDNRGIVTVETDMTDIGTGSYTIIAQTVAEMMGVPLRPGLGAAGRFDLSGFGRLGRGNGGPIPRPRAFTPPASSYARPWRKKLGLKAADARIYRRRGPLRQLTARRSPKPQASTGMVAEDAIEFGDLAKKYVQSTFGAHFVEVGVDAVTAEVRVRRMLAVCAAGRILNPKSARSQVIGAMTMGVGAALMEELGDRQAVAASSSTTTSRATRCRYTPTFRTKRSSSSTRPIPRPRR